ncbi:hypothetical protein [Microbacterium sp.]|uniref:hypothetical protein n=1 Tax=Microbacterium sp. TaxID=51671 RepID=UPI0028B0AD50|nr:hypothetical protein [Microbacterium sp.]
MPTLGLMADPGLPDKIARSIATALSREISGEDDDNQRGIAGQWNVQVSRETLPLSPDGTIPLMRHAQELRERWGWDYLVYLSDLPLSHAEEPMLCEVSTSARAAKVSLPQLGAFNLRSRVRKLLVGLVDAMAHDCAFPTSSKSAKQHGAYRKDPPEHGDSQYLVLPGLWNRWMLLLGMIRSNQPGRLLPALSSSVAAAVATGAFGIFYASMWNMADALPPWRLATISLLAVAVLSSWLIVHNRLWDRTASRPRAQVWRDNAATAVTIGLSVTMVYILLLVVLFVAALIVIAAGYLESQLGHRVSVLDYAKLSWLAASLGTLAGALGSNFDSDDAIREATYSRREHERRQLGRV